MNTATTQTASSTTPAAESPAAPSDQVNQLRAAIATRVALVAGVFVAAVLAMMAWNFQPREAKEPLTNEELKQMKAQLAASPGDESLKERIRQEDFAVRRAYFRQRRTTSDSRWLLLGGVAVLLVSLKTAATLRRKIPMPTLSAAPQDAEAATAGAARWGVAIVGGAIALAAVGLAWSASTELTALAALAPADGAAGDGNGPEATGTDGGQSTGDSDDLPSAEEVAKNWPRFRGPDGSGISRYADVPTAWDAASGKNILWKTAVPLPGNNSPVLWNDRVFLSGADDKKRQVFCFSTADGKLLWQKDAPGTPASTATVPKLNDDTGFAASTTATDGRRIFAMFANGDLSAFTFDGQLAWSRSLGMPQNTYGLASSLVVWRNRLLVQFDQGAEKDRLSKLMALDVADGKTKWETPRPVPNSWTTPIVIEAAGRQQIITMADPWAIAYNPADGKELWRAKCLRQDVAPSPVFAEGTVYTANAYPQLTAIRPDGEGDVTKSHILWVGEDGLPDTCSPLVFSGFVCVLSSEGTLTLYDAKTGKQHKPTDFDARFKASPSAAGKHIYLVSDAGKTFVVEPSAEGCKTVSEGNVGEDCAASPAFAPGRIYLRGKTHLFCIGSK